MSSKEFKIQNAFERKWGGLSKKIIVPNFTPPGWYECDLFVISEKGYSTEYEIKISEKDFDNDLKKCKRSTIEGGYGICNTNYEFYKKKYGEEEADKKYKTVYKYDRLKNSDTPCNRFFYILTEEVYEVVKERIIDIAGIIVASENKYGDFFLHIERQSKRFCKEKVSSEVIKKITTSFYYKYWRSRQKIEGLTRKGK